MANYEQAHVEALKKFPAKHMSVLLILTEYSRALKEVSVRSEGGNGERMDKAIGLKNHILAEFEDRFGACHPVTVRVAYDLAYCYLICGRPREAEKLMNKILIHEEKKNLSMLSKSMCLEMLGRAFAKQGKLRVAISEMNKSLRISVDEGLSNEYGVVRIESQLADFICQSKDEARGASMALELHKKFMKLLKRNRNEFDSRDTNILMHSDYLGTVLWKAKLFSESIEIRNYAYKDIVKIYGKNHPTSLYHMNQLGASNVFSRAKGRSD